MVSPPPSFRIIRHDGGTGLASHLPIDKSLLDLTPGQSLELTFEGDQEGTLRSRRYEGLECLGSQVDTIGPNSFLELIQQGKESHIITSGGHADFQQINDGLKLMEANPGDIDTHAHLTKEQHETYTRQRTDYRVHKAALAEVMERIEKRKEGSTQGTADSGRDESKHPLTVVCADSQEGASDGQASTKS